MNGGPHPVAAEIAAHHAIPTRIFLSMISHESGWNPNALSPVGAIGYGQLMPGTARGLGVNPHDPIQNLEGSARYLRVQYNRFGDWRLALAAYNAGPGAVARYKGVPPYQETQNYVAAIMRDAGAQPAGPSLATASPPVSASPAPAAPAAPDLSTLNALAGGNYNPLAELGHLAAEAQAAKQAAGLASVQSTQGTNMPVVRGSRYVNPFPAGAQQKRTDEGVDIQGAVGSHVSALGTGVVTFAGPTDPNGFGQMVVYKLTGGPHAGKYVYVGHALPIVKKGQRLRAGQAISQLVQRSGGNAASLAGWAEMGWAAGPGPLPLASSRGHYHANTPEGQSFAALIQSLGH